MRNFIIIKAGTTFPKTAKQYGDFEDWTLNGLGMTAEQVSVVDAVCEKQLPPSKDCSGVIVTGSHAMITDREEWSERLIEWIAELVDAQVPYFGICYGHQPKKMSREDKR
jgi:GMP synthase (glutamine-hydrolysing)